MKLIHIIDRIEKFILVILFAVMVFCVFAQVVNRNITQFGISWFEELARYCMVYLTILGAEIGFRDGTQLSIDAFRVRFPKKVQEILALLTHLAIAAFAAITFVTSLPVVKLFLDSRQVTPALKISMVIPFASVVIGMLLIAVTQTILFVLKLRGRKEDAAC